jgi:endonuclease YncB( thermonuclease family)
MFSGAFFVLAEGISAKACEGLRTGPGGQVIQVVDGDTLVLDNDVRVRLIGIQAPKLPLGREGFEAWPLANEAKQVLEQLTLGKNVEVRYAGAQKDRHGRILGHVFVGEEKIWAQGLMLKVGMARVYSFSDNRLCLDELYQIERQARVDRNGIWNGDPYYAVREGDQPARLLERVDSYEIVEGRVLNADRVGQRVYLNFGTYWREDFTVVIERAALRLFEASGFDPLSLEDGLVRVRGWVENRDGPRIEVTHPEQIEIMAWR